MAGSTLAPSCPRAWVSFMAPSSLSPSLLDRDRIGILPSLAVSYLPPRGRGPVGPRPDKPLGGRLWPGAGGRASPELRIFAARPPVARASPEPGGFGPGRGTGYPRPKRTPYEPQGTLWAVSRGRIGRPPTGAGRPG